MKYRPMHYLILALALVATACKPEEEPQSTAPAPVLVSTNPTDKATGVSTTVSVVFSYDQNIKCTAANQKKVTVSPEATIKTVSAYEKNLTISLEGLNNETSYTVSIPAGAVEGYKTNQEGAAAASISFTTLKGETPIPDPDPDVLPVRGTGIAWQMAEKIGFGWNLGNQMDAYANDVANETCWGNPACTQETFTKLKSYGVKTVRIPITWMGHIGAAPDYKIEEAWMNRVAEIVGYAEKAGLNCIINTHHDENHKASAAHWQDIKSAAASEAKNTEIKAEIKAVWSQIAEKFKSKGDWLIFESFNEINDGEWGWSTDFLKDPSKQYRILNEWNQVFVDAVRATGGNNAGRWLGIPGYAANPTFTIKGLVLPKDSAQDRLMVAVHCYDPSSFCGAGTSGNFEEWGHTGAAGKKPADDEKTLRKTMAQLYSTYVAKGIPCYFGECGCVNKTSVRGVAFQKYYLEYFSKAAYCYGMPCIVWDNGVAKTSNGEAFGYVNHASGEYIGNGAVVIPGMVKGQNDRSSSYTLDYIYNNAPYNN